MKKSLVIVLLFTLLVSIGGGSVIYKFVVKNDNKYNRALNFIEAGRYGEAADIFAELGDYRDSHDRLKQFRYVVTNVESAGFEVKIDYNFNRSGFETVRNMTASDGKEGRIIRYYNRDNFVTYIENKNLYQRGRLDKTGYEYDKAGRMKKSVYKSYSDNEKGRTTSYIKTEYEYNSDNLVKHLKKTFRTNDSYSGGEEQFFYYDNALCISAVSYLIDSGGKKLLKKKVEYTYDSSGRLRVAKAQESDKKRVTAYIYNKYGRISRITNQTFSGLMGDSVKTVSFYSYDADRLVKVVNDYENEEETYELSYDRYGNIGACLHTAADGAVTYDKFKYAPVGYGVPDSHDDIPQLDPEAGLSFTVPSI